MQQSVLQKAERFVCERFGEAAPICGLILGSGWGTAADFFQVKDSLDYDEIPGFGRPGVEGHSGTLLCADFAGVKTLVFLGRRHWYEGVGWEPIALPIYLLKSCGASCVVLTNAAGGIRSDLKAGDLMLVDDHINAMPVHPLIGAHDPFWGQRFPDQSAVYDAALRRLATAVAAREGVPLPHGVYLAVAGPTYETPAEVRAFRAWGADAVGMSTVPEAILANAVGLRVLGLSLIANLAAGLAPAPLRHEEIVAAGQAAIPKMRRLLQGVWRAWAEAGGERP